MDSDGDSDPPLEEERSSFDNEDNDEYWFNITLQGIRENNPRTTELEGIGGHERIENMTDEELEELGRDISNNTHLDTVDLTESVFDDHKMSSLFRGLTRSSSIRALRLYWNDFSVAGAGSMVPFLQNANKLTRLNLDYNDIQSEGFNALFLALHNSPIELLNCNNCDIESIEIDGNNIPQHLTHLRLNRNKINTDGCRELAKLLQGADPTLTELDLDNNNIDDEGVTILVDALQSNTSLKELRLSDNKGISVEGAKLCLRLVNDISTIKATLQSNRTLQILNVKNTLRYDDDDVKSQIQRQIDYALQINRNHRNNPEAAGREKVIQTQLRSEVRAELAKVQGVDPSVYSEINPLHLPEVLALVGHHHGQGELYVALKSSIAGVISTVNRKECIQQQMACIHQRIASDAARLVVLDAELAAINEAEGNTLVGSESHSNKRRRA